MNSKRATQGTQQVKEGKAWWVLIPTVKHMFSSCAEETGHYVW